MGTTYYTQALHFAMSGENKWVVQMDAPWPSGTYHCIFQYADGSTDNVNILVQ